MQSKQGVSKTKILEIYHHSIVMRRKMYQAKCDLHKQDSHYLWATTPTSYSGSYGTVVITPRAPMVQEGPEGGS